MTNKITSILCSIQRALLGKVTPNLRAVYVSLETNIIHLILYYDHTLTANEEDLANLIDTEFIADFPSPTYQTKSTVEVSPFPHKIPKHDICIYHRFEG